MQQMVGLNEPIAKATIFVANIFRLCKSKLPSTPPQHLP